MAKVIAKINKKTGNLDIEVNGIKGEGCLDITRFLSEHMDVYEEEQKDELFMIDDLPEYVENM